MTENQEEQPQPFKAMHDAVAKYEKFIQEAQEVFTAEVQAIANKHGVQIATGGMSDYWQVKKPRGRKWLHELHDKHPALDDLRALEKVASDLRIGPSNMMSVEPQAITPPTKAVVQAEVGGEIKRGTVSIVFKTPTSHDQVDVGALCIRHVSGRSTILDSFESSFDEDGLQLTIDVMEDKTSLPPDDQCNYDLTFTDLVEGPVCATMYLGSCGENCAGIYFNVDGDVAIHTAIDEMLETDDPPVSLRIEALNIDQLMALRNAVEHLEGALRVYEQQDIDAHDWLNHAHSLSELRDAFPAVFNP